MARDSTTHTPNKIQTLPDLAVALSELRAQGKRIVHCHGLFGQIHPDSIRYLFTAKQQGDVLVVTITPDQFANSESGPVFDEQLRAEMLAALQDVDYVAVSQWPTTTPVIHLLKPDVHVMGKNYINDTGGNSDMLHEEKAAVLEEGGRIHFADDIQHPLPGIQTSLPAVYPPYVDSYLQDFREQHTVTEIIQMVTALQPLKVMVVGEAILDEYVYGDVIGKSGKEPILAMRYISQEIHAGGSVVIANHLAGFCEHVELVTYLGEENTREDFIRRNLRTNVSPVFVYKSGSPTIVKRRFVEKYLVTKLLEVYEMNDEPLSGAEESELCTVLARRFQEYDAVIVADYGHGLITPRTVDSLCDKASFLAVNTQINAANNGFHTLSKYPRADYICVHEGEVRLDQRSRRADLQELVLKIANRMNSQLAMVTRGKHGSLLYHSQDGFTQCPALSTSVVDRIGAGDAVLAITSLCAAARMPVDVIGFIGNMVGAQAVTIVGNRSAIDRAALFSSIQGVLR